MKTKSSKTLKPVVTKKAKTGRMKEMFLDMSSTENTSPTYWYMDIKVSDTSSLKDISTHQHGGKWQLFGDLTRNATFEFSLRETLYSAPEQGIVIRVGPKGTVIRTPLEDKFLPIGLHKKKKTKKEKCS